MKTAVLISGQLRTMARCWPSQRWHLLRHFPDVHLFVVVQESPECAFVEQLRAELGSDRVHFEARTDPDVTPFLTPALTAAYHHAPYANATTAEKLLLQHWYQAEVYRFFRTLYPDDEQFHIVIRLRGDMLFHSFEPPNWKNGLFFNQCFTPWWGRFGSGCNDRVAVMGYEAAAAYFNVWDHIPALIERFQAPFHPETLLGATLEVEDINHSPTLAAEFSTLRLDGRVRNWMSEILPNEARRAA